MVHDASGKHEDGSRAVSKGEPASESDWDATPSIEGEASNLSGIMAPTGTWHLMLVYQSQDREAADEGPGIVTSVKLTQAVIATCSSLSPGPVWLALSLSGASSFYRTSYLAINTRSLTGSISPTTESGRRVLCPRHVDHQTDD